MIKFADFITPVYTNATVNNLDFSELKAEDVKKPLQGSLLTKFEKLRKSNKKIDDLWTLASDFKEGDRSARDFTLAKELKGEGFTLNEAAIILWNYPHGKVSAVRNPVREIVRCYERSGIDFIDSLDQETIDRIAKQVNPLFAERQKTQALIDGAQFIAGGEATFKGSGTPLFKHFMNQETVNVLFGPSGSGKSFLTLDFAMHLAMGRDWCGFRCKQKMAVLYICTESGSSFGKRAVAARERVGVRPGASLQKFPFAYYPAHVDLLNNKDHLKLIVKLIDDLERMSGFKVGLVIVDTLSAAFGGGNENSEDMTKFVNNMSAIKYGKKVAVLVVHHTGKDESAGARGHSSLKGNIDTEIQVRAEKRGEKWHRNFSSTKQKDDETGNMKRFGLNVVELGRDEDGDAITTCSVVLEGDTDFINLTPSIEDTLEPVPRHALNAIRKFNTIPNSDIQKLKPRHSTKNIKVILFNDLREGNDICDKVATDAVSQLSVMATPNKSSIRAFERACDILATKGLTQKDIKHQLVTDDTTSCDNDAT